MIAYFDLDKTFIDGSSGTAWLRCEIRTGSLKWWDVLLGFIWLTLYHVLGVHVGDPMRMAVRRLAGRRAEDFQKMAERVYTSSVRGRARRGALEALAEHRSKGHKVFLLSSSLNFIVDRVAEEYGFDGALSTQLEVSEDGLLTGNIVEPLCFGEGKVERAESHLAELGLGLGDCVFYSDKFAILLPPDPAMSIQVRVRDVAERARASVAAKTYHGVTLSACLGGISFAQDTAESAPDLVAMADDALARARNRGESEVEIV